MPGSARALPEQPSPIRFFGASLRFWEHAQDLDSRRVVKKLSQQFAAIILCKNDDCGWSGVRSELST